MSPPTWISTATSVPSTSPNSPRTPHAGRMFPLTSTSQSNQPIPNSISSASLSDTFGRFLSPDYRREQIIELHAALYGGRDKEEIREVVLDCYDANATFENPLTLARGQESIIDLFNLLNLVPGTMWSELIDVAEANGYDGSRLVVMTHSLNVAFLPFLDSSSHPQSSVLHPLHHHYSSAPPTPFGESSPTSHRSRSNSTHASWPISHLVSQLKPTSLLSALSTVNLKIHSKLVFNENGKITSHEDTWGIKEICEAIPMVGAVYAFNRRSVAIVAGIVSRSLFRPTSEVSQAETGRRRLNRLEGDSSRGPAASGAMMAGGATTMTTGGVADYDAGDPITSMRLPAHSRKSSLVVGVMRSIAEGLKLGGMQHQPILDGHHNKDYFKWRAEEESASLPTMDVATTDDSS